MTTLPKYRQCRECLHWIDASEAVWQCKRYYCPPCYVEWLTAAPKIELTEVGKRLFGVDEQVQLSFRPL